ncbi:hypothetical protein M5689_012642 [Euphorbia peplus]|nr:hypothetical protein M5689_012642 [Euphorbia peplus]
MVGESSQGQSLRIVKLKRRAREVKQAPNAIKLPGMGGGGQEGVPKQGMDVDMEEYEGVKVLRRAEHGDNDQRVEADVRLYPSQ